MSTMNTEAMRIPIDGLLEALRQRIDAKLAVLAERDRLLGVGRVRIGSYMENLALPELFGFDMNDLFSDPELALDVGLRHRIFWLDNSLDDWVCGLSVQATVGMYFDMTLFGQEVRHTPGGVPEFLPHPIASEPDLALLPPFDFRTTGQMPALIRLYERMREVARSRYGDDLAVTFPYFRRGPLDVCIQLRGYDNFAADTVERPQFVRDVLTHVVNERARWMRQRRKFLSEPRPEKPTCGIHDDWVNVPFISPAIFREFVLPAYRIIQANEGPADHFHTCGNIVPIVQDLLAAMPDMQWLDVSGWNDFDALDGLVDPAIAFGLSFINSFVLAGSRAEHLDVLRRIARVRKRRSVSLCAQAIVRLHDDFTEDLRRMNASIELAREVLS